MRTVAFLLYAAPPVKPAVEGEGDEENLQQRVGKEAGLIEDDEVEEVRGEDDGPADEQAAGGEPDAEDGGEGAGDFKPVRGEVVEDMVLPGFFGRFMVISCAKEEYPAGAKAPLPFLGASSARLKSGPDTGINLLGLLWRVHEVQRSGRGTGINWIEIRQDSFILRGRGVEFVGRLR